tara:strand:- start:45872 stop:46474 length:603 start_codon:yes stop_codon:yes gene_type:complete
MSISRLGILGGTFDPIHTGHLVIGEAIIKHCDLDQLLFIPSARPPHKQGITNASANDRYKMVELATQNDLRFEVSNLEFNRPGLSYMVDTLKECRRIYGSSVYIYLVMGADSLLDINTWYSPEEIFDLATVVAVPRPGMDLLNVDQRWRDRFVTLQLPEIEVSSTDVRERVEKGLSISHMVPTAIAGYIKKNGLYKKLSE